jgi:branched-chain amino acid transport system ATP-binding protein
LQLKVQGLSVRYDQATVLNNAALEVGKGEVVGIIGPNGAGKTTLLRAIVGLVGWERESLKGTVGGKITLRGSVLLNGEEVSHLPPDAIVRRGLVLCPERGRPFREMTVRENLEIGAYLAKSKSVVEERLARVFKLFPILEERQNQISGILSGGERTMLAISRSLMSDVKLLVIDEPSVGLAPLVKDLLCERIKDINRMGITVLVTEQDIGFAFKLVQRSYVLSQGQTIASGTPEALLSDDMIRKTYLGL